MYAIIALSGSQFKVEENKFIYTHRLEGQVGEDFDIQEVLLLQDETGAIQVGQPILEGIVVRGKILEHLKDDKITVFKKKRRKGYKVKKGHRQLLSKVLIEKIVV